MQSLAFKTAVLSMTAGTPEYFHERFSNPRNGHKVLPFALYLSACNHFA
jgi:putative NADPH-quinone reductase